MKKYKLLRPLPWLEAGAILKTNLKDYLEIDWQVLDKYDWIMDMLVEEKDNLDEWLEEIDDSIHKEFDIG